MILAVADDISGAAEIAAVGRTFGLTAQIQMKADRNTSSDIVVVDTDTRYRTCDSARDIKQALAKFDSSRRRTEPEPDKASVEWHYKKVDSVLRGNVAEELCAMMQSLQKDRTILAPANPTKARVISNGQYSINGQLLHETDFANDPDYPATTSNVVELLNVPKGCPLQVRTWRTYDNNEHGIIVAEAQSMNDLVQWSQHVDEHTLAAGGSDFFRSMLKRRFSSSRAPSEMDIIAISGKKLFVCGSASEASRKAVAGAVDFGIPVCNMPDTLFNDTLANDTLIEQWADDVLEALSISGQATAGSAQTSRVIIAILQPVVRDSKLAQNLRMKTAALVQRVVSKTTIHELFIEGGATAEAVLHKLQLCTFDVLAEYEPGVVQMRVTGGSNNYVTIKPGSYPWPKRIWI